MLNLSQRELSEAKELLDPFLEPGTGSEHRTMSENLKIILKDYQDQTTKINQVHDRIKQIDKEIEVINQKESNHNNPSTELQRQRKEVGNRIEESNKLLEAKDRDIKKTNENLSEKGKLIKESLKQIESQKEYYQKLEEDIAILAKDEKVTILSKKREEMRQEKEKEVQNRQSYNREIQKQIEDLKHGEFLQGVVLLTVTSALFIGYAVTRFFLKSK